ncbi:uncharacterized protein si:dkeyp-110g5.4 [Pungitius pungitius]|uniref:uncharacterized protein si:dkeyp-110g5.4 n=1 Tax=Pungitius pungitius TaxID=134920 RepID=UPI001888B44C|nr:uncharacterized protein si:dkeyp-110g5.4 [Pungitius pungitius]
MQSMDLLGKLEIYIPVEAEVKRIPLWSLPKSMIRGMGLPMSSSKGSGKLTDSPEGTWICPAVIRRKGQKLSSHAGNHTMENLSSLLAREFRANPGPLQMSFVSANHAVYKALNDAMHEKKVLEHTRHFSPSPRGNAPQLNKDAVILYNGQVYLSIRNPNQSRRPPETLQQTLVFQSSLPSTSDSSTKILKKRRSPQTCLQPAEPLRKKLPVPLPHTAPKQLKDCLSRPDNHSTADQELLRPKEKHTALKATHGEKKKPGTNQGGDVSSTTTARHSPPAGSAHQGDRAAEDTPATEKEVEGDDTDCRECKMVTGDEEADFIHVVSAGEADNTVDAVDQSGSQSVTPCRGEAPASASLQECDFKQLETEEKIARIKLKLRQGVAALNNLPSP